jgi:hypothetical protein
MLILLKLSVVWKKTVLSPTGKAAIFSNRLMFSGAGRDPDVRAVFAVEYDLPVQTSEPIIQIFNEARPGPPFRFDR